MTYLEKLKMDHPTLFDPNKAIDIREQFCPYDFGYSYRKHSDYDCSCTCEECWDREMPEESKKKEYESPSIEITNGIWVESEKRTIGSEIRQNATKGPQILDSGNRREFETGAVRDIQEGKGRCDLMPLDVVGFYLCGNLDNSGLTNIFTFLSSFQEDGNKEHLYGLLWRLNMFNECPYTMFLEVAKHFEEGAKKYGENNWQKGIPVRCYIDSAVRHYLKFLRGDKDEPHDRAFCWNIMCAIWTCEHKPELNDYAKKDEG